MMDTEAKKIGGPTIYINTYDAVRTLERGLSMASLDDHRRSWRLDHQNHLADGSRGY